MMIISSHSNKRLFVMPAEMFIACAHEDNDFRRELRTHLAMVEAEGVTVWDDQRMHAGDNYRQRICDQVASADLILLLVSPDFLASEFMHQVVLSCALQRHKANAAHVIPIILRPCDWRNSPISRLKPLPRNGKPITAWRNHDDAFIDIISGIRDCLKELEYLNEPSKDAFLWNVPPKNEFFVGRELELKSLSNYFFNEAAVGKGRLQLICGLGGIGKTQLAREFIHRNRQNYRWIFWVRADSLSNLRSGLAGVSRRLSLPGVTSLKQEDSEQAALKWLEDNDSWLLIFDNVEGLETLRCMMPIEHSGHLILTSRQSYFGSLGIKRPLSIPVLNKKDSRSFLVNRVCREVTSEREIAAAEKLAAELGGLPLALEQAGAYIGSMGSTFQDYLVSYRRRHLQHLEKGTPELGEYSATVTTTWEANFHQIEAESAVAADILRASSYLAAEMIPFEIIERGARQLGSELYNYFAEIDSEPSITAEALAPLSNLSLIELFVEDRSFSIHRMVQDVVRSNLDSVTDRQWAKRTISALSQIFPLPEPTDSWPLCERLAPHAIAVLDTIDFFSFDFEDITELFNKSGAYALHRGRYGDAENFYNKLLAIQQSILGSDNLKVVNCIYNLATVSWHQSELEHAERRYSYCLEMYRKLDADEIDIADSSRGLALVYSKQGRYKAAEKLFKRAAKTYEEKGKGGAISFAGCLNNLAELYCDKGLLDEAIPLYEKSLKIFEETLRHDDLKVSFSLDGLGVLRLRQGRFSAARQYLERALNVRTASLGSQHPLVAVILDHIAWLLRETGETSAARRMDDQASAIRESAGRRYRKRAQ